MSTLLYRELYIGNVAHVGLGVLHFVFLESLRDPGDVIVDKYLMNREIDPQ